MTRSPVEVVTEFYRAVAAGDGEAISNVIGESFDEEAAIEWPPSLPHGNRISGAQKLRRLFAAMAGAGSSTPGPADLTLVKTIGDGDEIVAWITFDWVDAGTRIPNSALELWRFTNGAVTEIRAFYWDHSLATQSHNA